VIGRAVAVVALLASTAAAAPLWKVTRGSLEQGRVPRSFILQSDAAPGRYSEASVITTEPVTLPYEIDATWRRLGPEAGRSMHVLVAGGVVLIKSGAIAFYAYDDTAFAQGEWKPLPGHQAQTEHAISVWQDRHRVVVTLDGDEVATYDLEVTRDSAHVGFGMKSAPGFRSAIYVHDVMIGNPRMK
jgi:hypothetical protein